MRRTKPQGIFLSCDHPQQDDATFKQIEFCGGDPHAKGSLRSILTDKHLELLGEIDEDWFENASKEFSSVCQESGTGASSSTKKQQDKASVVAVSRSKDEAIRSHLIIQETPIRKDFQSEISDLDSSPPLFTPDMKGKTPEMADGACHSTPSVTAESQTFSPLRSIDQDPYDLNLDPTGNLPSLGISPLEGGGPNPREDTPQVLRNLLHLQTPSTANKTQDTLTMSALQQTLDRKLRPTPQRLSKSLGAGVNDLNFSWTSSMATPFSARKAPERDLTSARTTGVARGTDSPQTWKPIIAKVLFAGSEKRVQKEPKSLDREESSEALQSLHFSSTEDEAEASDKEKGEFDSEKSEHHCKRRGKEHSNELKGMSTIEKWKETPLKEKTDGASEEMRKMGEYLGCGGISLMVGKNMDEKENIKTSDLEEGSPEKIEQKIDDEIGGHKEEEMPVILDLKMEKKEEVFNEDEVDGLHEGRSGKNGEKDDCGLGEKMENVEDNGKEENDDNRKEVSMTCDERKKVLETGEIGIKLEEENHELKKDVDKSEGEMDGKASTNKHGISQLEEEKGVEESEFCHEEGTDDKMNRGCAQIIESKVSTRTDVREKDTQREQNELDDKTADNKGQIPISHTLSVTGRDEPPLEGKLSEEVLSKSHEDYPLNGGSIRKEKTNFESETSKVYVEAPCGGEAGNTTHVNATQKSNVQHIQDIPETPSQNLQTDETCESDGSNLSVVPPVIEGSLAVMSPSAEAGLYGRLAILAETLNIPLAKMIEADRKARILQEAALRKATPPKSIVGVAYKPDEEIENQSQGNSLHTKSENEARGGEAIGWKLSTSQEVSTFEAKTESEGQKEVTAYNNKNSPPSLLPDESPSNGSQKSLNIADTLAFFLATPPLMQKRKSLGQTPPAPSSHSNALVEMEDGMGVSKIEKMSEKDKKMSGSPPVLTKKAATSVTPPQVDSSPNACLFSPLTPSTAEALLRATDEVSSSLESSCEKKGGEVNNNTFHGNEDCSILEASRDHLKEGSLENGIEMKKNVLGKDKQMKKGKEKDIEGEEMSSMLAKDEEVESLQVTSKNDTPPRQKNIHENGEKLDKSQKDIDSPVSFLKVRKNLSARKFLYPMSSSKMKVKSRLLSWQQNAVLDESLLEEEEGKEISDTTKQQLSESAKKLGVSEKRFLNRSKTGQFQTFNSFLQTELKESNRLGCPFQQENYRIDELPARNNLRGNREKVPSLSSKTRDQCDLNEGFISDPPELVHANISFLSGKEDKYGEKGDAGPLSHKMGPGGDAPLQSHLWVEDLEEERRCMESDEKNYEANHEKNQESSMSGDSKKNVNTSDSRKSSNESGNNLRKNSGRRMEELQERIVANVEKDFPPTEEGDVENLPKIGERPAIPNTIADEMFSLTEEFASGEAVTKEQTYPPFTGFKSARGEKIQVSESAIEMAKLLMQEIELDGPASVSSQNVGSSGNVEQEKHTFLSSKLDSVNATFNKSEKNVFAGFTSGAGKPIQISAKALSDAELLLEKFELEETVKLNEEQKTKIDVTMGSGKSENICQQSSDSYGHTNLGNTKSPAPKNTAINSDCARNENSGLIEISKIQGGFSRPARHLSKKYDVSKNYNHLPKGFRPFKPPSRRSVAKDSNVGVAKNLNKIPEDSLRVDCQKQNFEEKEIMKVMQKEDVGNTEPSCNYKVKNKVSENDNYYFEEEETEAHIVREIAAAEEAEMLYDFMKDDEVVDTQIDTLLTAASEEAEVRKQDEVNFDLGSQMKEGKGKVIKVEKVRSFPGVKGDSICLSSDVLGEHAEKGRKGFEGQNQKEKSHDGSDLRNVEQSKMSDISNDSDQIIYPAGNKSTNQMTAFVGFQTAKGDKIQISDEALEKAKQFLLEEDSEVSSNDSVSPYPVASENGRTHETSAFLEGTKSPPAINKKFNSNEQLKRKSILKTGEVNSAKKFKTSDVCAVSSSVETVMGKKVRFSEESLKNVQMELDLSVNPGNDKSDASREDDRKNSLENIKETLCGSNGPQSSFTGFQTGSGKQVTISKEALEHARQAWCNEGLVVGFEKEMSKDLAVSQSGTSGFQTASGSSIKISESALDKARKLLSEEDSAKEFIQDKKFSCNEGVSLEGAESGCLPNNNLSNQGEVVSTKILDKTDQNLDLKQGMFSGFKTASGSKVKISASSLEKAKNLLEDDVNYEGNKNTLMEVRDGQGQNTKGVETTKVAFQTAKGTKVSISDVALERAQQFLSEEGLTSSEKQKGILPRNEKFGRGLTKKLLGKTYSGFQTGKGSKVEISVAALEKAKDLWSEDIDIDPPGKRRKLETSLDGLNVRKEPESEGIQQGFQTAKGSEVKISQKALDRDRNQLWENGMDFQHGGKPQKLQVNQTNRNSLASNASVGFQTASGSNISISASALEKAKKFLEEDEDNSMHQISDEKTIRNMQTIPKETKFSGFQTGNGAKVEISAAAMERAKKLWSDEVDSDQDKQEQTTLPANQKPSRMASGFQTAKGNSVTVSQAALQKAQSFITEENENHWCVDLKETTKSEGVCGSMNVAQESQSSKNLKRMKEYRSGMERQIVPSVSRTQFGALSGNVPTSGFLTGRGKVVTISESSLKEARAKWDDQTDSGSLNMAEKFVSLPHKEAVLKSGMGVALKENTTLDRYSTIPANGERARNQVLENTSGDNALLLEKRKCGTENATDQGMEGKSVLKMGVPPTTKDQFHLEQGQNTSFGGLRAADMSGKMRHGHTSQFLSKVQKGASSGSLSAANCDSNLLPQRSSPASVLSDRSSSLACPLVSSTPFSESVIREPPANARVFKRRVKKDTIEQTKSHESLCLKQVWEQARMAQSKRIQEKKKTTIKPKPGYLSKHRKGKQKISLREAVDQMLPRHYSEEEILSAGVLPSTLNISAQSSSAYRFEAGDFFSQDTLTSPDGILVGDGGRLIPSDDGTLGAEEFKCALFDTPGVDPALVSSEWVENHFRWIVWKLASMEVAYPTHFGGRLLTPDRVLLQLKHRYDREIDLSQRSVLKKILERDEAASRRMVLCVAGVLEPQSPREDDKSKTTDDGIVKDSSKSVKQNCHLLLTDGWYAVKTIIDTPLAAQVESGTICIGTKLCLSGGELVGSQDACSPLEIPENLFFRISYNSTRRARFDARLGIQKDPRPFPIPLKSICGNGGTVGCVDVVIARVYPMQYMEKYPDGSSVFRCLRAEERAAAEFSKAKHRRMEMLYSQIQKKYEEKNRKESQSKKVNRSCKCTQEEIDAMTTGEELYAALTSSLDPGFLESCFTPRQVTLLQDYQRSLQEKQNQSIQEELRNALSKQETENSFERKVVSLIKIRVADYYGRQKGNPLSTSMLTIWRPTEDLISQLTEGKRFQVTNLSASGARFQWNSSCAQLASTRSTRYLERQPHEEILGSIYRPRETASLQSLASGCSQSMYGEVDAVGLVVAVKGGSGALQKVYLTDEHCHLVEFRFWNGLKSHYLEDIVQPGKFITASNLQVRGADTSVLHATELSQVSSNPKSKVLQQSLVKLESQISDVTAILNLAEESIDQLTNRQKPQRPSVKPSNNSNTTISSSGYSSASSSFVASPSGKELQRRDENDFGQGLKHHWVSYEGKVSPTPGTVLSTPQVTQQNQFAKQTPYRNEGISQFCRRSTATPIQMLTADSSEDKVSSQKKDIQRRSSLLARIPSPPPLTPLPDYVPSSLKGEFRTPVRGNTLSSIPMLSLNMNQKTSSEKKSKAVTTMSELSSSSAKEGTSCVFLFESNAEDGSTRETLTATQAARLEVGQLTDVEIQELAGGWSQPLSYSSSDENTPEMEREQSERGVNELKEKDGELHVPVDEDNCKSLEEETLIKSDSLKAGDQNTLSAGCSNFRGKFAQLGGRSLSRRKRVRVKQEPVDDSYVKRRKLTDDSCQEEPQSENHLNSLKLISGKDITLEVMETEVLGSNKPDTDINVVGSENEVNVRTGDKNISRNNHNPDSHASISEIATKSHNENLSGSIQNVSSENVSHGHSQTNDQEATQENVSEKTDSQKKDSSSVVKKGGRKRRFRRSNVNLALLDETNLQVSPEHDRLSGRLRKRSRPSYKE